MDYSQFLYMHEELSLLAVIVILFIADLFMCPDKKSGKGVYNTALPVILLAVHTLLNLLPSSSAEPASAFGGMYQYTPMMTIMKSVLNVGTIIVFLMAHKWLSRNENLVKQGEFYMLTLFTLLGMYFMISSGHFLMFFIGLELASVPCTALVAYDKSVLRVLRPEPSSFCWLSSQVRFCSMAYRLFMVLLAHSTSAKLAASSTVQYSASSAWYCSSLAWVSKSLWYPSIFGQPTPTRVLPPLLPPI